MIKVHEGLQYGLSGYLPVSYGNTATHNLKGNHLFGDKSALCGEIRADLSRKVYFVHYHIINLR